ncbi:RNA-binding protein [Candidatus Marinamargulisbacteria bacterium SCGC AAA071-K20]|nr:RNA-binding protein [Candidatus Marinamargulisbacteria bacterium SCGC AAA071-K20]
MSENKIYVGNLPYETTEEDLKNEFSTCGEVERVQLIMDRETGRSKGFAFVTFGAGETLDSALEKNGADIQGRSMRVNVAQDKPR